MLRSPVPCTMTFTVHIGRTLALLVFVAVLALVATACVGAVDEIDNGTNGDEPTTGADVDDSDSDDADEPATPPMYVVETAEDPETGTSAAMLAYGQPPIEHMDALIKGELARSGECLGLRDHHEGRFVSIVWPYGYSVEFDGNDAVLLDENGEIIAREGEPISMGGGGGPDHEGRIAEIAPEDCVAGNYWMAGAEVRRLAPVTEPEPALDNGVTVYFPQWDDDDDSQAGPYAGRLVLKDACLYLHHERAGDRRLGIWPPEWNVETDGEDVVIVDEAGDELARTGDILSVASRFGQFDVDEYAIPGQCASMHAIIFELEVTGGPDDEMPEPHVQTPDEAREQDAQMYADAFDVSLEEALWRLDMQERVGPLNQSLQENEADRFGGLYLQHEPDFRVVVLLTDGDEDAVREYIEDSELQEVLEVRTVELTLQELEQIQREVGELLSELDIMFASGQNIQENRVEVYVADRPTVENALNEAGVQLPENVMIVIEEEVETLDEPED